MSSHISGLQALPENKLDIYAIHKAFKKLKNKNSAGCDGISQSQLLAGAPSLSEPLRKIFNLSIESGEFPKQWKMAIVTPVLKKGDCQSKENYRPVSCLPSAAKLLESVVCDQLSHYFEISMLHKWTQTNGDWRVNINVTNNKQGSILETNSLDYPAAYTVMTQLDNLGYISIIILTKK